MISRDCLQHWQCHPEGISELLMNTLSRPGQTPSDVAGIWEMEYGELKDHQLTRSDLPHTHTPCTSHPQPGRACSQPLSQKHFPSKPYLSILHQLPQQHQAGLANTQDCSNYKHTELLLSNNLIIFRVSPQLKTLHWFPFKSWRWRK